MSNHYLASIHYEETNNYCRCKLCDEKFDCINNDKNKYSECKIKTTHKYDGFFVCDDCIKNYQTFVTYNFGSRITIETLQAINFNKYDIKKEELDEKIKQNKNKYFSGQPN